MNIVILGPQGSGKGTQSELLSEKFQLLNLDVGAILRELSKTRPDIDAIVNKRGALVDDAFVFNLVSSKIESLNRFDNLLFDGYPRTIAQYSLINPYLVTKGTKIDRIFFLAISDEEAIRRLSARRMHRLTGHIYNLITNPPPKDVNPEDLIQREDDTPEAISERLHKYHEVTQPLIEHLRSEGIVFEVDGSQSIDAIFQQLCQEIEKLV